MAQDSKPEKIYAVRPNKSQLKRDHEKIKKFVITLIEKTPQALKKTPINENIIEQVQIAQNIKGSAYRRQIKHIANQLVKLGEETLQDLLDNGVKSVQITAHKTLLIEKISNQLIEQMEDVLEDILNTYPQLDRQKLRSLVLSIRRDNKKEHPSKTMKILTQYLHEQIHPQSFEM